MRRGPISILNALPPERQEPSIDFASATDGGLEGVPDPEVLELAASENRILVTHDRRTMPGHFPSRLAEAKSSPGVFLVSQFAALGPVVETLVMVWAASEPSDWRDQIRHLPPLSRDVFQTCLKVTALGSFLTVLALANTPFGGGFEAGLHPHGALKACKISHDVTIQGPAFHAGDHIHLDACGNWRSVHRKCNIIFARNSLKTNRRQSGCARANLNPLIASKQKR